MEIIEPTAANPNFGQSASELLFTMGGRNNLANADLPTIYRALTIAQNAGLDLNYPLHEGDQSVFQSGTIENINPNIPMDQRRHLKFTMDDIDTVLGVNSDDNRSEEKISYDATNPRLIGLVAALRWMSTQGYRGRMEVLHGQGNSALLEATVGMNRREMFTQINQRLTATIMLIDPLTNKVMEPQNDDDQMYFDLIKKEFNADYLKGIGFNSVEECAEFVAKFYEFEKHPHIQEMYKVFVARIHSQKGKQLVPSSINLDDFPFEKNVATGGLLSYLMINRIFPHEYSDDEYTQLLLNEDRRMKLARLAIDTRTVDPIEIPFEERMADPDFLKKPILASAHDYGIILNIMLNHSANWNRFIY